jgi:hypothetical protein
MWNLIVTMVFTIYLNIVQNRDVIIIIDDCVGWAKMTNGLKYPGNFILYKNNPREESVSLGHAWFDSEQKLSTKTLSFSELVETNILYASELDFENWIAISSSIEKGKIYVLLPEDYCSVKRFNHNQKITLYETILVLAEKL